MVSHWQVVTGILSLATLQRASKRERCLLEKQLGDILGKSAILMQFQNNFENNDSKVSRLKVQFVLWQRLKFRAPEIKLEIFD